MFKKEVDIIHLLTMPEAQAFIEHLLNAKQSLMTFLCLYFQTLQNQCYQSYMHCIEGSLINMSMFPQLVQRGRFNPHCSSSFKTWHNVRMFCSLIQGYINSFKKPYIVRELGQNLHQQDTSSVSKELYSYGVLAHQERKDSANPASCEPHVPGAAAWLNVATCCLNNPGT